MVQTNMSPAFLRLMRKFEETLSGMRANAVLPDESWIGGPKEYRERCASSMSALAAAWTHDSEELAKLQQLTKHCLDLYARGEVDEGTWAAKDIDEFLIQFRERATMRSSK
jgi:hypothetical protein